MLRSPSCAPKAAGIIAVIAVLAAAASAQSAETFVANTPYSSDYEVESWSEAERTRQTDYLEQQYLSSDELFGGPVRKPGEPRILQTRSRTPLTGFDSPSQDETMADLSAHGDALTPGQ